VTEHPAPVNALIEGLRLATEALGSVADRDWSTTAAGLDWTCRQTVDHLIDCVFSYTLQIAGQAHGDWLALDELHARSDATPGQLVEALRAVGSALAAVLQTAPDDLSASDGIQELDAAAWVARALHEVLLHTSDVLTGLGVDFEPAPELCEFVLASPGLWAIDRDRAARETDPWPALLAGSGRATR
jgi:hypothetical protein